jgi:hypothetical protein
MEEVSGHALPPQRVRELARRLHVHYEVYPDSVILRDHSIRSVGFCVELYGQVADHPGLRPESDRAKEVYGVLREISTLIVPDADDGCRYQMRGSSAAFYFCGSQPADRGCVRLEIRILHRDDWDRPIDAFESRALQEIEDRLDRLGVPRGRFH